MTEPVNDDATRALLTKQCDDLTDNWIEQTRGMSVGPVLGACLNLIRHACTFLPAKERGMLAARLRNVVALDVLQMVDGEGQPEPGSGPVHAAMRAAFGDFTYSDEEASQRIEDLAQKFLECIEPGDHVLVVQSAALNVIHMGIAGSSPSGQGALAEGAEQAVALYRNAYGIPRVTRR